MNQNLHLASAKDSEKRKSSSIQPSSIENPIKNPILGHALFYARRGWPVLPLQTPVAGGGCTCGNQDCSNPGKHPRTARGFKDATTDPSIISQWWSQWPDANIGVATGILSGLLVIDIDPRHGGIDSFKKLLKQYGTIPKTLTAWTGGHGLHKLFQFPKAPGRFRNKTGLAPGIDVRADGGYFVAAPSLHVSGHRYHWLHPKGSRPPAPASIPDAWLGLLKDSNQISLVISPNKIPEGKRNESLFRVACAMNNHGCSEKAIFQALTTDNVERCEPPLLENEVLKIAKSAQRYIPCERLGAMWPDRIADIAFCGLPGEIVKAIEPHSESDPVALLIQLLIAFGNVVGRRPHFRVEADQHCSNLFAVLVGATSKARKGSSFSHVKNLFKRIDSRWISERVKTGLSSGEGLIYFVRDQTCRREPIKEGNIIGYREIVTDEGVKDKRLLAVEPEFAQVLKSMSRDGNILSAVIRSAWDSGSLSTLTKNSPVKATGAHISIIGHVTQEELRRLLRETEQANGFGNRFLWLLVRRSKCLPDGGQVSENVMAELASRLSSAVSTARGVTEMKRGQRAQALWRDVYPELSEGHDGLAGSITTRAEAQVSRLSMLYSLMNGSPFIRREYLEAALALWKYAEDSAACIFKRSRESSVAQSILKELKRAPDGLTRTQISDIFKHHRSHDTIDQALTDLADNGRAVLQLERTNGRPVEWWFASELRMT